MSRPDPHAVRRRIVGDLVRLRDSAFDDEPRPELTHLRADDYLLEALRLAGMGDVADAYERTRSVLDWGYLP